MIRLAHTAPTVKIFNGIFSVLAVVFLVLFMWSEAVQAQAPLPKDVASLLSNYKLAAGDVITIRVFGEDDLSREKIRLSDAGTIPYPVLGEVQALGLTIGEIEKSITAGLTGRYLVNPRVSITIERASFSKISIIREGDTTSRPQKAEINSPVNPGDTVFIEESFF